MCTVNLAYSNQIRMIQNPVVKKKRWLTHEVALTDQL